MNESIRRSIEAQLAKLGTEERRLNNYYDGRMRVANDGYYAGIARSRAKREAMQAQKRLDEIITRKIELAQELRKL
ncbi:hypothetical protein ACIQXW_23365 [Lysinibacillus sp. NPDC097162]|uniref:hypothetical protein n=1 Tax=Lysinibacillus sp. NPDC097162 TaxID=3364140 RepID=UPI00380BEA02